MLKTSSPLICYFFLSYRHVNHDPVPQWLFLRVILDRDLCATCLESRKWLLIAAMDFTYIPWLLHTFLLWCGTRDSDNLVPYFGTLLGVGRKVQIWDCHLGGLLNVVLLWWCRSVLASCPMGYCFAGCYLLPCFVFTSTVFLKLKVLLACLQARLLQERCINDLWLFRLTWRTAWWTPIVVDECQIWFNSLLSLSCCWISR